MRLLWTQLTITDKDGGQHTGEAARDWAVTHLHGLVLRRQTSIVILRLGGTSYLFDNDALDRLRLEVAKRSARIVYTPTDAPPTTPQVMVRRETGNAIQQRAPTYVVELSLGDIDALFEPIANRMEPWKDRGVRQRLQVLGYLYTPLQHPSIETHAQKCWAYYKDKVHGAASHDEALTALVKEIQGNIVSDKLPGKGELRAKSALPAQNALAALRFPGGYGITKHTVSSLNAGDHELNAGTMTAVDAKYQFGIGDQRQKIEAVVAAENPLLGAIPLIAKVTKRWPDGRSAVVSDAPVYFQLVAPDDVPDQSPFAAPPLPDKVMNYDLVGLLWSTPDFPGPENSNGLDPTEWKALQRLVKKAVEKDEGAAETQAHAWIDAWKGTDPVPWDHVSAWWADQTQTPYTRLLSLDAATVKASIDQALNPAKSAVFKGLSPEQSDALERLVAKAKATGDPQGQATTWLKAWLEASNNDPLDFNEVQAWETTPGGVRLNLGSIAKVRLEQGLKTLFLPPAKPGPTYTRLTDKEWEALLQLASKAKQTHAGNAVQAKALAEQWIDHWAAAPKIQHDRVKEFWPASEQPYPVLRENIAANARERASAILKDRGDALSRKATIDAAGQKKYIEALQAQAKASFANDPQNVNAPNATFGGKLGHPDGIKAIFDTTAKRDGLHTARPGKDDEIGDLELATLPDDAVKNPHAVVCKTNALGFAGVLFTPSRIGGDRYKLKAYVGSEYPKSKKARAGVIRQDTFTGTLVTWRNVRIARYLQMRTPSLGAVAGTVTKTLGYGQHTFGSVGFQNMKLDHPVATAAVMPGVADEAEYAPLPVATVLQGDKAMKMRYRPVAMKPNSFVKQLQWAFCEVIADCAAIEEIDAPKRQKAAELARAGMERSGLAPAPVDWSTLIYVEPTSPFLLNFRSFKEYNEIISARGDTGRFPALDEDMKKQEFGDKFGKAADYAYEAIAEHFAHGGVLPGLTLIQFPRADTWDLWALEAKTTITSGYGTAARAAFLSHTEPVYRERFTYSCTGNAIHEFGHVFWLVHQPPAGADCAGAHQPGLIEAFQKPDPAKDECVCVMSYSGCYGDYCGRCILAMRGWAHDHTFTP